MGKKRKKHQKTNRIKMPFWDKIFRQYGQNSEYNNHHETDEQKNSKYIFAPSPRALIYASEFQYITRCIQDYPDIETGGQLYGAWTASGAPRVIYAIGPGPHANHEGAFFNQDLEYLETIGAKLKEYGLQHIGEWHSHHKLGLPHPSVHDAHTMQNGIVQLNLNRFLLCIGSINDKGIVINPFNFARDTQYVDAQWEVIKSHNRLREVIDTDLGSILCHPHSTDYSFAVEYFTPQRTGINNHAGWFSNIENRQAFKQIIDYLTDKEWTRDVTPQIASEGVVSLKITTRTFAEVITFPFDFPTSPFIIDRMGLVESTCDHYTFDKSWETKSDLIQSFKHNYYQHLKDHSNG